MAKNKTTVGELVYEVHGDMSDLRGELRRTDAELDKLKGEMRETNKNSGMLSNGFNKLKIAAAAAGTALLYQLGRGIRSAVQSSIALEESINAVNVVFGEGADRILEFGETAANQVGLAQDRFNQMATKTGALLGDTGLSMDEVSEKTIMLTKRAADLASVHNTSVKDALSAVNQALRGETEAIRRYAGNVTDATLEQYALSEGINESVSEMTEQEKRLLRVKVIMDQTNEVAGDFQNTSDSLANSIRILRANSRDLAADYGSMFSESLKVVIDELSGAAENAKTTEENIDETGETMANVTAVAISYGKAILFLKNAFVELSKFIGKTFTSGIKETYDFFRDNTIDIFSGELPNATENASKNFADFVKQTSKDGQTLKENLQDDLDAVGTALEGRILDAYNGDEAKEDQENLNNTGEAGKNAGEDLKDGAEGAKEMRENLIDLTESAQETRKELQDELSETASDFGDNVSDNVDQTISTLAETTENAKEKLKELRGELQNLPEEELEKAQKGPNILGEDPTFDEDTEAGRIQKQIEEQKEILASREGFEKRQAERIKGIRERLAKAGIDAEKAGLESLMDTRSLEEQIEEEREKAQLNEFELFERQQAEKLRTLTDNFIAEAKLLKNKIEKQKQYETELTQKVRNENEKRYASTEKWAQKTIDKYGEVASSLQKMLSTEQKVQNLSTPSVTGRDNSGMAQATSTNSTTTNTTNKTNNVEANVTINGGEDNNLTPKEISEQMGFEFKKYIN